MGTSCLTTESTESFPEPDGPEITMRFPRIVGTFLSCSSIFVLVITPVNIWYCHRYPMSHGFGLNCRQNHMTAVGNDYRPRLPSVGGIDQHAALASFLDDPLDRCRLRADYCHDPVCSHHVPETYVDELNVHGTTPTYCPACSGGPPSGGRQDPAPGGSRQCRFPP